MAEHAMLERHAPLIGERRRGVGGDYAQTELDVPKHAALLAARDLRAVDVLARLAQVMHERGAQQEVAVEPRVYRAQLDRQARHGYRVLQQAAEAGVVDGGAGGSARGQRAWRSAQLGAQLLV